MYNAMITLIVLFLYTFLTVLKLLDSVFTDNIKLNKSLNAEYIESMPNK